jgi:hypothetical protein
MIDDLKGSEFKPSEWLADTAYGGDENHSRCLAEGIDLTAPTPGKCPDHQTDLERLTVADFTVEPGVKIGPWGHEIPDPKCVACPAGLPPVRSFYNHGTEQLEILQLPGVCNACPLRDRCPTRDASLPVDRCRRLKSCYRVPPAFLARNAEKGGKHQQTFVAGVPSATRASTLADVG